LPKFYERNEKVHAGDVSAGELSDLEELPLRRSVVMKKICKLFATFDQSEQATEAKLHEVSHGQKGARRAGELDAGGHSGDG
jgi:hypothetical protein